MPMYRRRRYAKKKRSSVTKALRFQRRKRYIGGIKRLNTSNQGYLNVNRRLPLISASTSNQSIGGLTVSDPTGNCVTFGTPVAVPNGLNTVFDVPFVMRFSLNQLVSFTEFTTLFDQYKINAVKVALRSYANTDGTLAFPMPWIEHWNDHDSALVPTISGSREIMGVKHKYLNATKNVCTMYVKPKFSIEVNGTSTTGMISRPGSWLDCADSSVEHLAIKGIIHNYALPAVAPGNNRIELDITMNVSFKDVQ